MTDRHIGAVTELTDVIEVTLSLNTSAYADGDLLADAQEIPNFFRDPKRAAYVPSFTLLDKDDQGGALDIFLTNDSTSWGTENSALTPADAVADGIQGVISILAADYVDLVTSQIVTKSGLNLVVKGNASTSLYIAAASRDAKTYTASGIVIQLGVIRD